ncbi:hypothetical protein [Thermococcus litoralis]|uniref:hypothetical protein n=1 Tax=Thermococcus litoralis TaxID=2265 RepID=UPI000B35EAA1|nr:hypothetical protein [Thermococcus litoralis]
MNGVQKLKEIREIVKEELKHIPRGNEAQNMLRMIYWNVRLNSLGKKPKFKNKEECLKYAIKVVQETYPEFDPQYDKEFFKLDDIGDSDDH